MSRSDQLYAWARPDGVLLPHERTRLPEFLDLFAEQLALVAVDAERPTIVERFVARKRTADLWAADRLTDDGDTIRKRVLEAPTRHVGRGEHFAEADIKARLLHLTFEQLEDAERLLRYGRNAVHVSDEPLPDRAANVVRLANGRRRGTG